ncbi:MAG: alpha/beta hydrolase [Taibaiella sp.]|jgi:pimeloyl-ACP methyl ester carboxylesterase
MTRSIKTFSIGKIFMATVIILFALALSSVNSFAQKVHNIVLVHGAFADGSGWQGVYNHLTKKGYHVSIVANPNTGLVDDVAATKRVLDRLDGPAILVGHSYGGAIIIETGLHKNVAGLVFIAALLLMRMKHCFNFRKQDLKLSIQVFSHHKMDFYGMIRQSFILASVPT